MFFFPLVMPNILATLNTKAVTDLDCGSRCNKAVTTLARRFGSSMENQRLIVRCLRYRWWSRRSTVVVSSRSLPCAVVLSFVYSPCHALNVVYLGWQVLVFALCGQYCRTYHSLSVVCLFWSHAGISLQGNANIDKIGDRQDRLNLSTAPSQDN